MELLSQKCIKMNVEAETWQDAVRAAGRVLVETGAAEESYVEGMVHMVTELGPYIVMTPGIAIPHARPEEGAKEVGFAAVKLAKPINFGNQDNDPVYLVLGFCTPNSNAHVELLARIAEALGQENILEKIKAADTPESLADIFNNAVVE